MRGFERRTAPAPKTAALPAEVWAPPADRVLQVAGLSCGFTVGPPLATGSFWASESRQTVNCCRSAGQCCTGEGGRASSKPY